MDRMYPRRACFVNDENLFCPPSTVHDFLTPPNILDSTLLFQTHFIRSPPALSTGALVGIALGSAAALALLLALIIAVLWPRQRRRWAGLDVCREFSMGDILRATDNWASANVLGKGGFATVYKGVAPTGELWAVKRISLMSNDFENEVGGAGLQSWSAQGNPSCGRNSSKLAGGMLPFILLMMLFRR
ncbi:unnamed protein product [Closterium sp. NIES-53]